MPSTSVRLYVGTLLALLVLEGEIEPSYWWLRTRLHRLERWLFGTHPPTEERLESLAALERKR